MDKNSINVLILTNNVAPYRHPLFSLVAAKFRERGANVRVWFMRERENIRFWDVNKCEMEYEYEILQGVHFELKNIGEIHFNKSIWRKLLQINPSVVIIGGYNSISSWIALIYCKIYSKKVILWSGSILTSIRFDQVVIKFLKKMFIRNCDAFISYGSKAREFLEFFGAETGSIFVGCNVGDVDFYRKNSTFFSRVNTGYVKLIFVGRLVKDKGIYNLIKALKLTNNRNIELYVVGDGPEKEDIELFCKKNDFNGKIYFVGFKQKEDLVLYYNNANIFILPTFSDKFGIVYSEALSCGLFVIASKYAGASYDIIEDGVNGLIVDPHDIVALASSIDKAISMLPSIPSRHEISESVAGKMDLYAQQFVAAVDSVLRASR